MTGIEITDDNRIFASFEIGKVWIKLSWGSKTIEAKWIEYGEEATDRLSRPWWLEAICSKAIWSVIPYTSISRGAELNKESGTDSSWDICSIVIWDGIIGTESCIVKKPWSPIIIYTI